MTHGHEEEQQDGAYSDNKGHQNEWKMNTHSVCVTHPAADVVRRLEGTQYVTISLVLPVISKCFRNLEKDYLPQHWDDATVPVASIGHSMKEARKQYLTDLTCPWVTELSTNTKRLLNLIAALLDPRYKHCVLRSEAEWRRAETALRNNWQHCKEAQNESSNVLNQGYQPKRPRDLLVDSDGDVEQV